MRSVVLCLPSLCSLLRPEHPDWSICTQKHIGDLLNIHLANSPANSSTLGLTSHFISFGRLHSNWSPTFCLFSTVYLPRNMLKCTHHDKVPAVEIHFKIVRCEGSLGGRGIFFFLLSNFKNVLILCSCGQNIRFLEI